MKKLIGIFGILLISFSSFAADFTGVKIYVNPGHGGYNGGNDRNLVTINYELNDTLGFWESKSNLHKGLALRDMLQAANATVIMSRTRNRDGNGTENPDGTNADTSDNDGLGGDDRSLSEIAAEANANNVDAFIAIHSNAVGTNTGTNYLLILYHGATNNPTVAASLPMAQAAWPRLLSNQLTNWTFYTTTTNIQGDFTFYGNTSGLGVLRPLTVPGFLSEGSFHDYQPETHRLLNTDYKKLEGVNLYRYFCDYFQRDLPATGIIAGFAKAKDETFVHPRYTYKAGTNDRWKPLNGAKVKLMNAVGDSINSYQVDSMYNGIFAFYNLTPGTYKLRISNPNYTTIDTTVTVMPAVTTYAKMLLADPNVIIPKDTTPNYPHPVQEAGAVALKNYNFGSATPSVPEWLNGSQIRKVLYNKEKMYILTEEPKLIVANANTFAKIREMDLTGITGGMLNISDINFTSDGFLLASNKDTVGLPETKGRFFKVYTWDNDSVAPSLLFQTQSQGNWSVAVVGESFGVAGPRSKCKVYTLSVTTGSTKAIRVMGLLYEDGISPVGYKYMMGTPNYTEALWGKKTTLTLSPTGSDHFYLDSEKILPTEFQFDWAKPDRDPLVNKGTFNEKLGYQLPVVASGNNFFRFAKHVFMAAPVCNGDSTAVGVTLFDVTDGLNNAVKISEKLPQDGLGNQKATFMAAAAKVTGYDIDLIILAQNQGVARFKTLTPTAKANIYASELKFTENSDHVYVFGFTLNENADDVKIEVLNGTDIVKTFSLGALAKGVHSEQGDLTGLPGGEYTWSITASTSGVDRPTKISNNSQSELQFYSPRGVAVDNSFESPYFGRIYASETTPAPAAHPNRKTKDGVYILNAALQDITNQGANSYAGSITWGAGSSPMRLSVAEDGQVYITDWSDSHPGVWVMNPAAPTSTFKPVFSGLTKATTGLSSMGGINVHGSIAHCWVTGTGVDTKLFTFDEDYIDATTTSPGNLLQYNIGLLETPWQAAPTKVVYNDGLNGNLQQNMNSCITPDGRGGWWISQYRGEDAVLIPSLIHVGTDGMVDFNSGKTPTLIGNSYTGGMAVNPAGTVLAMGCQDEVKVFSIVYSETGVPTLTRLHSIKPAMGSNTAGISYDRAGNLYVISNTSESLGVWAMPKADNQFTTLAPSSSKLILTYTGVEKTQNSLENISTYPNPVVNQLNIDAGSANIDQVSIFSLKGELIRVENSNTSKLELPVSDLISGVYILKIKTNEGTAVRRIMKK